MSNPNPRDHRPVFLYIVVAVLSLALIGLGGLSVVSMMKLGGIQKKLTQMQQSIQEAVDSADIATQKAEQLENLQNQLDELTGGQTQTQEQANTSQSTEAPSTEQQTAQADTAEEGTLSPSNGSAFTQEDDDSLNNLLSQLQPLLPQNNGTWSVYVCNLLKGTEGDINNTPMQAASLIKLFIMGTVYENYSEITQANGTENVDQQLNAMITVSDNDAANTLVTWLGNGDSSAGMARVNAFCQAHGYTATSMGRLLLQSNENGENYTSVRDCGHFLKEIYQLNNNMSTQSTLQGAEAMYYLLKCQTRRNKIPAGIPEGVGVANKTGELSNVENDAAIIYNTAKGIDLVICFMSENLNDVGAAQSSIANNSHIIYGYYNE